MQDVVDDPVERFRRPAQVLRAEDQLLADRPRKQHLARALEDIAEDRGQLRDGALGDRPALDEDLARGGLHQAHRGAEERCLAGAVRPEHGHRLATTERCRDPGEHLTRAVAGPDVAVLEAGTRPIPVGRGAVRACRPRPASALAIDR